MDRTVLLALGWGLLVLLSFAGLGRIVAGILAPGSRRDLALEAGWGMAGMIALGGWFNLLGLATAQALRGLVLLAIVLGLAWDILDRLRGSSEASTDQDAFPSPPPGRRKFYWISLLGLFLVMKYVASLNYVFNLADDLPSYLFQVARLLQNGSIGPDPFSDRQLLSLNGLTFLLGLLGASAPLQFSFLLDPGICWFMVGGLTWSLLRYDLRASPREACLWTGLVLMVHLDAVNLSGRMTGAVLYLTLFRTAYTFSREDGTLSVRTVALLALVMSGLCALKLTFIIPAGLFLATWYGMRLLRTPALSLVVELGLMATLILALVSPWMWQQYRSAGTPFYPLLGKGYHLATTGLILSEIAYEPLTERLKSVLSFLGKGYAFPAILGLLLLPRTPFQGDRTRWQVLISSMIGAVLGSVVLSFFIVTLGDSSIERFTQAFLYAALIPAGLSGWFSEHHRSRGAALACCLAMLVGNQWEQLVREVACAKQPVVINDARDPERLRKVQNLIPPGKRILVSIQHPFLLDCTRNSIWSLDLPGMVSPPPGLPITEDKVPLQAFLTKRSDRLPAPCGGEKVLEYLRKVGVDYLVFQRRIGSVWYLRSIDPTTYLAKLEPGIPPRPMMLRVLFTIATLVHQELLELLNLCPRIYDDGDLSVLEIGSRAGSKAASARELAEIHLGP